MTMLTHRRGRYSEPSGWSHESYSFESNISDRACGDKWQGRDDNGLEWIDEARDSVRGWQRWMHGLTVVWPVSRAHARLTGDK